MPKDNVEFDFAVATRGCESVNRCRSKILKGLSFESADLQLIRRRAQEHGLRMAVRLRHASDVDEYEEVFAPHSIADQQRRSLMLAQLERGVRAIDRRTKRALSIGGTGNRGGYARAAGRPGRHPCCAFTIRAGLQVVADLSPAATMVRRGGSTYIVGGRELRVAHG
jgi:hypothetical protein